MIKKQLNPTATSNSIPNLEAYLEQAKSFRSSGKYRKGKRLLQKAALSAVIPLAAASTANTQCVVQGTYTMMFGSTTAVYKILTAPGQCNTTMMNALFCSPGSTMNTSFLLASAMGTLNASCAFYCVCGGIGGTIIIDGSDGLGPVPVELTKFVVAPGANKVILNWETASEINNSGFEVLRSTDGFFFQKVAWVDGQGNSVLLNKYEYIDTDIRPNTTYYYRLNQLDFDGSNDYSPAKEVTVIDKTALVVGEAFPNPVKFDFAKIEVNTPSAIEARVILFDARGKMINEGTESLESGTNYLRVNVRNLSGGIYFAKVMVGQEMWYRKIIVQ